MLFLELFHHPLDDALIEVVATQVGIAVGRLDLDDTVSHFQDGNVERAAAEIVDGDGFLVLLFEPVGQCCRGGLVNDSCYVQAGDLAGVFGRLALGVVEVGWDGDHRVRNLLAEIVLRGLFQLGENLSGDLGRRVAFAACVDTDFAVLPPVIS